MSGTVTTDQFYVVAETFPHCDMDGGLFPGGACVEDLDSGRGFTFYEDYAACSGSWILVPGFNLLPKWFLAIIDLLWLIWLFFGVAVVSDVFVDSIVQITSTTKKVKRKTAKGGIIEVEVPVWNWVVANITLMALGSSSPEILLAIVETCMSLGKPTEELGASTIIGSSSFNLYVITAVCTVALGDGVFKKLDHMKVFVWTTIWMLWAHLWIWLVYNKISPGRIEIWEAFVTLGFMPVFVQTSYLVDIRGWNWLTPRNDVWPVDEEDNKDGGEAVKGISVTHTQDDSLPPDVQKHQQLHSILYYRQQAVNQIKGGGINHKHPDATRTMSPDPDSVTAFENVDSAQSQDKGTQKVMFKSPQYSCLESAGAVAVQVMRLHGDLNKTLSVTFRTEDDTAVAGLDYEPQEGTLVFEAGEDMKEVEVKLLDDEMGEPDVSFYLRLGEAELGDGEKALVLQSKCLINIVDNEAGGIISFELPSIEAGTNGESAELVVVRRHATDGVVTVKYATREGSAAPGLDYKESSGMLVFNKQETKKTITIPIVAKPPLDPQESLSKFTHKVMKVVLTEPTSGAQLGARSECRIILVPGEVKKCTPSPKEGGKNPKAGTRAAEVTDSGGAGGGDDGEEGGLWDMWGQQFKDAIMPEFEDDDDTVLTCFLHYMNITWKLLAACMPPAEWKGGYPSFFSTLAMLAGMMAIVKEVAGMFGCNVGLSEVMTGISIVALGTSLPDTFASRMAAITDTNADAAIGNVMGSNSCNIFLGLGIPWVIASCYYEVHDTVYSVNGGSLGFSVIIFFAGAVVTLILLLVRRKAGGELGGTKKAQWICFAILIWLWLAFLIIAGLYDSGHIPRTDSI